MNNPTLATLALAACFGATASTQAQQAPRPTQPYCEVTPEYRQFDFWLGTWDVYNNAPGDNNGKHAGVNVIEKGEGGCVLYERWKGDGGGSGFSMNYYNAIKKEWRQVWIAPAAYSIDYSGGLDEAGRMVLEGTIYVDRRGDSVPFRGTWTPNADGTVRQFFEQYDAESDSWQPWFDGKYVRRKDGDPE